MFQPPSLWTVKFIFNSMAQCFHSNTSTSMTAYIPQSYILDSPLTGSLMLRLLIKC